ncbi:MAG TPA: hypothetical protein VFE61_09975 [Candidatus Sulfotelmatobacter sp.]|jgi:hypothetical protein|nr:hypothetical protein [Candidatus Sulfotelmatobacter sp.]
MRKDDDLEKYLSEFRPRAVRPLEMPRSEPAAWPKRLTVAAMVLICAGGALWYAGRRGTGVAPTPTQMVRVEVSTGTGEMNPFALTKLALEDDGKFQAQLAAESRLMLPNFHNEQSMLRVLAKE